jgi:hypothetical protein
MVALSLSKGHGSLTLAALMRNALGQACHMR